MKIAIEASAYRPHRTGIALYTVRLVDALLAGPARSMGDELALGYRLSRWRQRATPLSPAGRTLVLDSGGYVFPCLRTTTSSTARMGVSPIGIGRPGLPRCTTLGPCSLRTSRRLVSARRSAEALAGLPPNATSSLPSANQRAAISSISSISRPSACRSCTSASTTATPPTATRTVRKS